MDKLTQKTNACRIIDLGILKHQEAYAIQQATVRKVIEGGSHTLIFCEHPPVLTLGRLATEENFLYSKNEILQKGVEVLRIDRGGEVTFHGPGQLVIYPIFHLERFGKDLKLYLHKLEQVTIDLLCNFGIVADRILGQRGIWVKGDKIASIGVGVRKWVAFHGMAINVNTDLKYFSLIKPCGLDVNMTSLARLKGTDVSMDKVKKEAIKAFREVFDLAVIEGGNHD